MKSINAFAIASISIVILVCNNNIEPIKVDQMQAFVNSSQIGTDSVNVNLNRGGQADFGFSMGKSFLVLPNVQFASLSEMKDLTFHISNITRDSFYLNIRLSNNSSMPNISKLIKFNWIAFPSSESNSDIFCGSDTINFSIARGDSQINILPFHHTINTLPIIFSTSRTAFSDVQINLNCVDSTTFAFALLFSKNSSSPMVQGAYTLQWLAMPSGINKSGVETGNSNVQYSLNRGECIQKIVNLSNLHLSQPCILYSNQNAIRDVFVNLEEVTNTSFKINLCLSNNSSSPNVSGIYNFSWAAISK